MQVSQRSWAWFFTQESHLPAGWVTAVQAIPSTVQPERMHTRVYMHSQPGLQGYGSPPRPPPCSWPQPAHSLHPPAQRSSLQPPWPRHTDTFRLGGGGCESGEGGREGGQGRRSSEGHGWGPPPFPLRRREGQTRSLHRSPVWLGLAISLSRKGGSEDRLSLRAKPDQPENGDSLWLRKQPGYP